MLTTPKRWTWWGRLPVVAAILLMVPFDPCLVSAIFGPSYAPIGTGLQVLLLAAALNVAFFWPNGAHHIIGKSPIQAGSLGASVILGMAQSWPGIQLWGIVGACVAIDFARFMLMSVQPPVLWHKLPHYDV